MGLVGDNARRAPVAALGRPTNGTGREALGSRRIASGASTYPEPRMLVEVGRSERGLSYNYLIIRNLYEHAPAHVGMSRTVAEYASPELPLLLMFRQTIGSSVALVRHRRR